MDKVSVIIPVYNTHKKYLDKCIGSLINQTYKNLEVLLVDDGSKKDTADLLDNYSQTENRIRVIHQNNTGVAGARNTGMNNCGGGGT